MNKQEWHQEYKRQLIELAGFTERTARQQLKDRAGEFDYGYSPGWYVREELACKAWVNQ